MKTTTGDALTLTLRFVQVFTKGNEYEMVGGQNQPPIIKTLQVPAGATTRMVDITNVDLSLFWRDDCMSSAYAPRMNQADHYPEHPRRCKHSRIHQRQQRMPGRLRGPR